jgi:hypothetical protein
MSDKVTNVTVVYALKQTIFLVRRLVQIRSRSPTRTMQARQRRETACEIEVNFQLVAILFTATML